MGNFKQRMIMSIIYHFNSVNSAELNFGFKIMIDNE